MKRIGTRSLNLLWVSILVIGLLFGNFTLAQAATPPVPSTGTADVDGFYGEWDLTEDYFAPMHKAANSSFPILARLYLRYECPQEVGAQGILYALVLAEPGWEIADEPLNSFLKLGNDTTLVNDQSGDDGTPPDFLYIYDGSGKRIGWEASTYFAEGILNNNFNVHTNVLEPGQTSSETAAVTNRSISIKTVCLYDYGDLPENYGMTTFAQNGARHIMGDMYLGTQIDIENDGTPDGSAYGDDMDNLNDEEGILPISLSGNTWWSKGQGSVQVTVTGPENSYGCLMGWLDFWDSNTNDLGSDGDFNDTGEGWSEQIINNVKIPAGPTGVPTQLFFPLPDDVSGYPMFARFRLVPAVDDSCEMSVAASGASSTTLVGLTGMAVNGEVEDYRFGWGPTAVVLHSIGAGQLSSNSLIFSTFILLSSLGILLILAWRALQKSH